MEHKPDPEQQMLWGEDGGEQLWIRPVRRGVEIEIRHMSGDTAEATATITLPPYRVRHLAAALAPTLKADRDELVGEVRRLRDALENSVRALEACREAGNHDCADLDDPDPETTHLLGHWAPASLAATSAISGANTVLRAFSPRDAPTGSQGE